MAIEVARWLEQLGLEQYEPVFRDNFIDGDVLPQLTAEDLIGLGVTAIGHRRKLLFAIAVLGAEAPAPAVTVSPEPTPVPGPAPASAPVQAGAERRQLTVMFCDIVGSTALSTQFDPEDLRELINDYHRAVAETVARFGGFVAKYMGDGVLIYFGYPQAHEDDAERSVRAGLAVIEAVAKLSGRVTLRVRIGVATGLAVVGDLIGAGAARERGVVGETPNLAARVQGLAEPNTIVIADGTRRQIGGLFDVADLGAKTLAGFAEPQHAWRVIGESGVLSRFEAMRSGSALLVGRDEDFDHLMRRWERTKSGEGQVVLLSGEPGIGKSRLTASVLERLEKEPHTRLRYFCSPHYRDSALWPVISQIEHTAGFERDDTAAVKHEKLGTWLGPDTRDAHDFALLSELLSLPGGVADLNLSPARKREKLFDALLGVLEVEARKRPVLMVFEDAHWIDPTSRELLDLTIDQIRRLPVLLLITFRPEFQSAWGGRAHVSSVALRRLGEREGEALARSLAGDAALSPETIAEIVERSDGVPLFVEELIKAVLESEEHNGQVPAILAAIPATANTVPPTLHAALLARLDRLGPTAREIAQIGAVLGREFAYELVEEVARRPESELRAVLKQLGDAELLFCRGTPPHSSYIFKHALVQDAAYGTLLRGRRQELHGRAAAALERLFADVAERRPELLAQHLTGAAETEQAVTQWLKAGRLAIAHSAHREAANHLGSAIDLLRMLPSNERRDARELELNLVLAVPLIATLGFGSLRVEGRALRAKELSDKLPDLPGRFAAQRIAWNSCLMRQPVPKTLALARDLVKMAELDQEPARIAIAYRALGYSLFVAGGLREANEVLTQGAMLADAIPDEEFAIYGEHPSMVCRLYSGQVHLLMGFAETGASLIEAAVTRARRAENPHSLAWALGVAAHSFLTGHETAKTGRFASEAIDVARVHRLPQWLALGERCNGWAIHQLGDRAAGLNIMYDGVKRWNETGAKLHTTHCETALAEAWLNTGQNTAASEHLAAARAHCHSYGEAYLAADISRLEAVLLRRSSAPFEFVRERLSDASQVANQQGARLLELRCATTAASALVERGEHRAAHDLLAPVYSWFTEGFDAPDLKDAKALLDELA